MEEKLYISERENTMRYLDSIYVKNNEWVLQKARVIELKERERIYYKACSSLPRSHPDLEPLRWKYGTTTMALRVAEAKLERIEQRILRDYIFKTGHQDRFEDMDEFIERVSRNGYVRGTKL